jgi:hypothetical protein
MTPDIERIAREAAAQLLGVPVDRVDHSAEWLRQVEAITRVVAAECAHIAQQTVCDTHLPTGVKIYGTAAAKAIRERFGA